MVKRQPAFGALLLFGAEIGHSGAKAAKGQHQRQKRKKDETQRFHHFLIGDLSTNCKRLADFMLKPIDWIVLRNRLGAQNMVNKEKMGKALDDLAKRIGFRVAPGFNERVIFRELFPRGLTLLDLKDIGISSLNISNVAARQELRDLIKAVNLPGVEPDF